MKEGMTYTPAELTTNQPSPRLEKGVGFMAESKAEILEKRTVAPSKAEKVPLTTPSAAVIEDNWRKTLGEDIWKDPHVRSTASLAAEIGIKPDDAVRLEDARTILGKEILSSKEKQAILDAHDVGGGQLGKDKKRNAEVGNYTREQIREKAEILKEAGLEKDERRALMKGEIVGFATKADLPEFTTDGYTDSVIANHAAELERRLDSDREADTTYLQNLASTLRTLKNSGVSVAQADRLLDDVEELRQVAQNKSDLEEKQERDRIEEARQREQSSSRKSEHSGLAEEVAQYNEGLRSNPDARNIQREQELIRQIKEAIYKPGTPPVDAREFPDELLRAAGGFRETREMLISQIIFKAYEDNTERNEYRGTIDLYAQDSLKKLLSAARLDPADPYQEQYQILLGLETSAELFHTMNAKILAGTLEEFSRTSERIDPKHFSLMNNLRGVGQVMRLYEQKYSEALAKNSVIYDYDAVKEEVEKSFREMAKAGFIKTEYDTRVDVNGAPSNKLENWEIERALNVGRNFSNITFRAGEYMALGEPAKLQANIRFGSAPQESTVKLLNHLQWVADRFDVGGGRGGTEFYKLVKEKFHASNLEDQLGWNRKKIGRNKIVKFGGRTVDQMELAEFFGTRSFYSSWRLTNMSEKIEFSLNGQEKMTLKAWSDANSKAIDAQRKQVAPNDHGHVHHEHMSHVQHELVKIYKPLVDSLDSGLGILLVSHGVGGEPGYLVRQMIWEKVARTNTPMMMNYLQGLKMDGVDIKSLESLQADAGITGDRFDVFKEKLLLRHQKGVLEAAGHDVSEMVVEDLTQDEQRLEEKITEEGEKLAPHLADVLFAYTPFMNDVSFENFDYEGPGQEAYKRLINDFGQYSQAQHGYDAIQDHVAGGAKIDDVVGALKKMESGMSGPPGPKEGMTRSAPVVEAVLDFYEAGGDSFMAKQLLYRVVMETLEKPTSKSQEFGSVLTEALDEAGMRFFLEKLNKAGVISHPTMLRIRSKKRLNMSWLWAAVFRDLALFFVGGVIAEAVDEGLEDVPVAGSRSGGHGGGGGH